MALILVLAVLVAPSSGASSSKPSVCRIRATALRLKVRVAKATTTCGAKRLIGGSSITCDKSKYTWSNSPTFTFSTVSEFGAGKVQSNKYAWDQSPTHAWTGSELTWSSGMLSCKAGCHNSWYLHIKGNGARDIGPYNYRPARVSGWSRIFPGIESASGSDTSPRLMKAFAMRVDLRNPAIRMFASPGNGDAPDEVTRQTTPDFLIQYGLKVAVNTNFFLLNHPDSTIYSDVWGWLISNGTVVSGPYVSGFNTQVIFTKNNVATIADSETVPSGIYTAVGGSEIILRVGAICTENLDLHPRTSLGLSWDRRYLIICVVDGRQEGWSMGCNLPELSQWMLDFGTWTAMNCDGGGSSCLVKSDGAGGATILNKPSQGHPRADGANLGVFSSP